jgi:acetylornithine deacetylase/succinyl-diaminopimelate desuccinylase-like protein
MNPQKVENYCNNLWDESIIPELVEYIKNPCKSPAFDPDWEQNGFLQQAIEQFSAWAKQHAPKDMQLDVLQLPGRTPLLFIEVPGHNDDTILMYGHMDKQPEMVGWEPELGPWKPVMRDNKLYGRGGADDGYALFASLTALLALQEQNIPHARCVIIIEACEESGSYDLPYYIDHLQDRIGEPSLVICLDSGAGNYQQLWNTTSLRGMVCGDLSVKVLTEGVHSGAAGGVVPESFTILRDVLNRIENSATGEITLPECKADIPTQRLEQAAVAANVLQDETYRCFPFVNENVEPGGKTPVENILLRTWHPSLAVTGLDGMPNIANAGNVLRPETTVRLAFRLPPTCNATRAAEAIKIALETSPPHQAEVKFTLDAAESGWNAPAVSKWLANACDAASDAFFNAECVSMGEGGSIPFMGMLGEKFPKAQFLITGVLGPKSNAHGPNEFLHIPMVKKVTCCVAAVVAKHFEALA